MGIHLLKSSIFRRAISLLCCLFLVGDCSRPIILSFLLYLLQYGNWKKIIKWLRSLNPTHHPPAIPQRPLRAAIIHHHSHILSILGHLERRRAFRCTATCRLHRQLLTCKWWAIISVGLPPLKIVFKSVLLAYLIGNCVICLIITFPALLGFFTAVMSTLHLRFAASLLLEGKRGGRLGISFSFSTSSLLLRLFLLIFIWGFLLEKVLYKTGKLLSLLNFLCLRLGGHRWLWGR